MLHSTEEWARTDMSAKKMYVYLVEHRDAALERASAPASLNMQHLVLPSQRKARWTTLSGTQAEGLENYFTARV